MLKLMLDKNDANTEENAGMIHHARFSAL